jgi:hypothetical protein
VLGEALGGPERYRGPDIAGAHRGLGISDAHFDRPAGHLGGEVFGRRVLARLEYRRVAAAMPGGERWTTSPASRCPPGVLASRWSELVHVGWHQRQVFKRADVEAA